MGWNLSFWVATTSETSSSLSFQLFCGTTAWSAMSWNMMSGVSPLVSPATIFCIAGPNGMRLYSILLPLAFS